MLSYFKKNNALVFVAFLYFIIQLPFLNQLSLLRGERDIMLTAYSIAHSGRDLYGNFLPLQFFGIDPFVPFVPFYIAAIWWFFIPIRSVFLARLFFVFISLAIPFLIYEIVNHLSGNKKIAIATSFIFCFSPGIFHLTRLALEIGIAFPLLLMGILFQLKHKRILSYVFYFLSFFSYYGFRPLIPILVFYIELYPLISRKIFWKKSFASFIYHVIFIGAIFVFGIMIDGKMMQSRKSDVAFFSFDKWTNEVIYRRNTSQAPQKIASLFDNKLTVLYQYMRDVFVKGFDLRYLFLNGDDSVLYATTFSGQFFLVFILFYFLGFIYLARLNKWNYYYIAGFIFIGLIPSVVNISYISYSIRSMLSTMGFSFIMACGAILAIDVLKNMNINIKRAAVSLFIIIFAIELTYFIYNYYTRRFITMSELYFENEQKISRYLLTSDNRYVLYTNAPRDTLFSYLFFNNTVQFNDKTYALIKKGQPFDIGNYTISLCPNLHTYTKRNEIIMDTCLTEREYQQYASEKKYTKSVPYSNYSFRSAYFIFD